MEKKLHTSQEKSTAMFFLQLLLLRWLEFKTYAKFEILYYKIIQNISNIMSLVSQNDTKCKRHFIQRIYHSQLVWEPDKKIPREKTMKKYT